LRNALLFEGNPCRLRHFRPDATTKKHEPIMARAFGVQALPAGATDESRTRYLVLTKDALYLVSYGGAFIFLGCA
jgi:hypothetical protein